MDTPHSHRHPSVVQAASVRAPTGRDLSRASSVERKVDKVFAPDLASTSVRVCSETMRPASRVTRAGLELREMIDERDPDRSTEGLSST